MYAYMHLCIYPGWGDWTKSGGGGKLDQKRGGGGQIRPKAKEGGGGKLDQKRGGGPVRHQARRQDLVGGAYSGEDRVFLA